MALTKQTVVDKIETIVLQNGDKTHYVIQVRESNQIFEDGNLLTQTYQRYALNPDNDLSTITDDVVKNQFNTIMTDEVKENYQTFLVNQEIP